MEKNPERINNKPKKIDISIKNATNIFIEREIVEKHEQKRTNQEKKTHNPKNNQMR